jgi:3-oxoacyl-[acyl-carrier protein] reductase
MDLQIKNKNALITGGSRGLGKAAALHLAQEGVNVSICGRSTEDLESTAKEIKNYDVDVYTFICDVSDLDSLAQMHNSAVEAMGDIDILVNNVGGTKSREGLEGTSMDDFKGTFDLNVFSAFELMKLVIPGMKNKQWGRIVNISSIWGKEYGGNISYMTTKSALIAATKHAARDLAKNGITINSIAPGSILHAGGSWEKMITENTEEFVQDFIAQNLPMGKFGWPESLGTLVAYLCSDGAGLINGSCVVIDGGQSYSV